MLLNLEPQDHLRPSTANLEAAVRPADVRAGAEPGSRCRAIARRVALRRPRAAGRIGLRALATASALRAGGRLGAAPSRARCASGANASPAPAARGVGEVAPALNAAGRRTSQPRRSIVRGRSQDLAPGRSRRCGRVARCVRRDREAAAHREPMRGAAAAHRGRLRPARSCCSSPACASFDQFADFEARGAASRSGD